MLEDVIEAIDSGKIKPEQMVVCWFTESNTDGVKEFNRMIAGATWMEYVALMAFAFKRSTEGES